MTQQPSSPQTFEPYAVTLPGGLSNLARSIHTVLLVISCGWWAPIYFLAYLISPIKRVQVMAPPGTDPRYIEQLRLAAMKPTDEDRAAARRRLISAGVIAGIGLAVGITVVVGSRTA